MSTNKDKLKQVDSCIKQLEVVITLAKKEGVKSCIKFLGNFVMVFLAAGASLLLRTDLPRNVGIGLSVAAGVTFVFAAIFGGKNLKKWLISEEEVEAFQEYLEFYEKDKQRLEKLVQIEEADIFEFSDQQPMQSDEIESETESEK